MYWTGKSMNNLLSYCGLVDARINASEKDLPVRGTDQFPSMTLIWNLLACHMWVTILFLLHRPSLVFWSLLLRYLLDGLFLAGSMSEWYFRTLFGIRFRWWLTALRRLLKGIFWQACPLSGYLPGLKRINIEYFIRLKNCFTIISVHALFFISNTC